MIDVGFTSLDPAKAARIANAVGDAYLVEQLEARYDAAKRASTWLNERMQGLAQQVQSAEKAVAEYRTTHKIVETSTGAIDKQQVAELSAQLALSRARTVETRAKFEQAERTLSRGGNMAAVAEVLQSPVIASLRTQEAEVARREADLTSRYGPLYPQVVTVRAELADIHRGIKSEIRPHHHQLEKRIRGRPEARAVAAGKYRPVDRSRHAERRGSHSSARAGARRGDDAVALSVVSVPVQGNARADDARNERFSALFRRQLRQ